MSPIKCQAMQRSDQMLCPCGLAWDVNDPEPPTCPATKQEERRQLPRTSSLSAEQAHAKLSSLSALLRSDTPSYYDMHISGKAVRVLTDDMRKATSVPGRMVVCAAVVVGTKDGRKLVLGPRHYDQMMHAQLVTLRDQLIEPAHDEASQGFIDQWGVFMTREEALIVAYNAGQLGRRPKTRPFTKLFSEDLY